MAKEGNRENRSDLPGAIQKRVTAGLAEQEGWGAYTLSTAAFLSIGAAGDNRGYKLMVGYLFSSAKKSLMLRSIYLTSIDRRRYYPTDYFSQAHHHHSSSAWQEEFDSLRSLLCQA